MTSSSGTTRIVDLNAFDPQDPAQLALLDSQERDLVQRHFAALGPAGRLFYRHPVQLVGADTNHVFGPNGQRFLDAYNNVPSIGHAHPAVADAVSQQLRTIATHTRYLQPGIVNYSEQLLALFPTALNQIMFTNSGSESNDLALRVAAAYTGGTGIVVTNDAYHGTTAAVNQISPANDSIELPPHVRAIPAPDTFRLRPTEGIGVWFAEHVSRAFADLAASGHRPSALVVDTIFSSSGVFDDPSIMAPAAEAARRHGAVVIADEVQPGFARVGSSFWGFKRHQIVPEIVTLGKPMGNGVPVSGMVAQADVLAPFATSQPYFNTFGGSSVPIAAAQAVLDTIVKESLPDHADDLGSILKAGLVERQAAHPALADVRGAGLYIGFEFVAEAGSTQPDKLQALRFINGMRDNGVLLSACGMFSNTIKMRPMLSWGQAEVTEFFIAVDRTLKQIGS